MGGGSARGTRRTTEDTTRGRGRKAPGWIRKADLGAERLLDDDAERAVVAFPAAGDDAVRDLFLERQSQDIEEGRSAGRRVPFDETQEKRRRHRKREVAADRERRGRLRNRR